MRTLFEPCFYSESRDSSIVMHYEMQMNDPVDGEILKWAVNYASERYPYFRVKVDQDGESLVINPNPAPIVVREGISKPVALCSAESNYHVCAVIYEDDTIFFELSHMVSDGQGRLPWVKSILYYYITKKYGVELDSTGINLVGSEITEEEIGNPFPADLPEEVKPFFEDNHETYMRLEKFDHVKKDLTPTIYFISMDEQEFMKLVSDNDATPATMCCSLMAKAIYNVHGEETVMPITDIMCINHRPALKCPKNYHFLISAFRMAYTKLLLHRSLSEMGTVARGEVFLNSEGQNSLAYASKVLAGVRHLESLPTLAEKRAAARVAKPFDNATFVVSYVGKVDYGCAAPYIKKVFPHVALPGMAPLLEINAMSGRFWLSLGQNFATDVYAKAFASVLEEYGVKADLSEGQPLVAPIVDLD